MISENNKAKILNKLFKVKLVTLVEQLVPLLKRIFEENCQCCRPASVIIPCELMKKILNHGNFPRKCFDYFWHLYLFSDPNNRCFDRSLQGQLSKEFFRKHFKNVINASMKKNFPPKVALVKNYFQKFNKSHMTAP